MSKYLPRLHGWAYITYISPTHKRGMNVLVNIPVDFFTECSMAVKTTCPVSRKEFADGAKPVEVVINGVPLTAEVKEFSTGSLGWYLNGKMTIKVGDKPVTVQIGMNMTIIGSKDLPKDA